MDYKILASYYERIENTPKRMEKTDLICELLEKTEKDSIRDVILLLQGKVFPDWDERKIGTSTGIMVKALCMATGMNQAAVEREVKDTGDLGLSAEKLISNNKQSTLFSSSLSVKKVFDNIKKLSTLEGSGMQNRKVQLLAELMTSSEPIEARYITRTVLGELRVGASIGTLRDAIIKRFFPDEFERRDSEKKDDYKRILDLVQRAYDLTNDIAEVVTTVQEGGIEGLEGKSIEIFKPVNPMLFYKAKSIDEAFSIVGRPAFLEYKYDGFRIQIHKRGDEVRLFTRRLEEVTEQFPDIVEIIRSNVLADDALLDAEVMGIDKKTGKMLPFQNISQRIRRKHDIKKTADEIPVVIAVFDMLKLDKDLLDNPFMERRKMLSSVVKQEEGKIVLSEAKETDDDEEANAFYEKSLLLGNEGIMVKSLDKSYKPGARVGFGVKIKPVLEPLDLAITRAEWGHGKRAGWLTSYTVACKDGDSLLEIGKVGTGIKELEGEPDDKNHLNFKAMTEYLRPLVISENGASVKLRPDIMVEVDYEEIQKSTTYESGFALRFPRIKRLREDIKEPSSLDDVKAIYKGQRGREE